jgi:acyl carrier protein
MNEIHSTILNVVRSVAREKTPELDAVRPDQMLVEDLGLRSLDLARIIAKLEMKLGVDPFAKLVSVTSIRTAGDLCNAYAKCFAEDGKEEATEPEPPAAPRARDGLAAQRELRQRSREV